MLVDRVNKKHWAIWMIGLQAALLFLFVYLYQSDIHALSIYYIIGFFLMLFNYGYFNSQVSLTKEIVSRDQLTAVNAKITFTETLVGIMGPMLSGLVFMLPDISNGILITATCYFLCMLLFFTLPVQQQSLPSKAKRRFVQDLWEGWTAFRTNRPLWMMTVFVMFSNCTSIVIATAMIFYAKDSLQLSSSLLAIVLSLAGIGGLLGSSIVTKLRRRYGLGKIYGGSIFLCGLAYLCFYISSHLVTFGVALFIYGFATSLHNISIYTFRHEQTPSHLMGRIAGITGTLFRTGMPIAMYFSGYMALWWGSSSIFISSAIWNLIVVLFFIRTRLVKEK
jgi:predicted MFS family arabinose efflux permease